jgi:exo-beta-1,3-glucanase (GH17 family)
MTNRPASFPRRALALCLLASLLGGASLQAKDAASTPAEPLAGGRRPLLLEIAGKPLLHGISFSPYRDGQEPGKAMPSDAEVLADLQLVSRHWGLIRMYDATDLSKRTLTLIRTHKLPLRAIIGAWITGEKTPEDAANNRAEIARLISLANAFPDLMPAAAVGNEACVAWSGHRAEPSVVAGYARSVRAAITQPVTSADDYNFWNKDESRLVAAELDFIIFHAYALWNSRSLEEAMSWTGAKYDAATAFHAGIPIIIGETGWASRHDPRRNAPGQEGALMKAEVSDSAQAEYLRQHYAWVKARRVPAILFEAFDEAWKGGGATSPAEVAEKHWGVFDSQRRPKPSFPAVIEGLAEGR